MMRSRYRFILIGLAIVSLASCAKSGKSKNAPEDGQARGVAPTAKPNMGAPLGMVYVPPGTFHMGPSDEDITFSFTSRNRQVSIPGFWMDATEITNNQYRQFVIWVRDSVIAVNVGEKYIKVTSPSAGGNGDTSVVWSEAKKLLGQKNAMETLGKTNLLLSIDDRLYGKPELDLAKIKFRSEKFELAAAVKDANPSKNRSRFIRREDVPVYPDTLVWMRDFSYAYNEPMTKRYFSHPSFGKYPVVGVNWKQAVAYCDWRSHYLNSYLEKKKLFAESNFRLPSEAEWEYAARGGRSNSMYPWGNYYLRNKKGCLLANFKPGRGNYPEDGGFYTVRVDAYWPNDFGLYNMAGNVAEWTNSYYYEGASNFVHDLSPDIRYNAKQSDPPRMKRKVVRGGSWKDVGYFLQTSTRTYEYQDTAKSYIGFRCVIDLAPKYLK